VEHSIKSFSGLVAGVRDNTEPCGLTLLRRGNTSIAVICELIQLLWIAGNRGVASETHRRRCADL
jgi:hypothetical protein